MTIEPGVYYHFKDPKKRYEVLGTAFHTETEELMVVYKPLYEGALHPLFARPLVMFLERVEKPELGYAGPRFIRIGDA
ncbi:MAG TPA: DUF1653 domain-containing protein [Candidatus Paceibacterota bacterium]|nr:DUF1653 domain-containing protein [Candidatus Paceibacterota bacterium]